MLAEPATTEVHDRVRQGVVLYMGSLAKHIPPDDPKVSQVVSRLSDAHQLLDIDLSQPPAETDVEEVYGAHLDVAVTRDGILNAVATWCGVV